MHFAKLHSLSLHTSFSEVYFSPNSSPPLPSSKWLAKVRKIGRFHQKKKKTLSELSGFSAIYDWMLWAVVYGYSRTRSMKHELQETHPNSIHDLQQLIDSCNLVTHPTHPASRLRGSNRTFPFLQKNAIHHCFEKPCSSSLLTLGLDSSKISARNMWKLLLV